MSDNESSDGDEELQQLIAEFEKKEKAEKAVNKSKTKTVKKRENNGNTEVPMDKVLFGDKSGFLEQLAKAVNKADGTVPKDEDASSKKRKPVWTDADDEAELGEMQGRSKHKRNIDFLQKNKKYKEVLTDRFTRILPQPKWANLDREAKETENSDDELLRTVGFLSKPSSGSLPSHKIHSKRLKDLNRATYSEGLITSIQFHPTSTAALVSGKAGTATIYSIDGYRNDKLHSVHFRNFPILCARIKPCGTKAIFGSMKSFYYSYDLLTAQETRYVLPKRVVTTLRSFQISSCGRYMAAAGRFGAVHLFDAVSHELIYSFQQEDNVAGLQFTADSQRLVCSSKSCNVNIFSIRQQRIEHIFIDDGCINGRVLALSPNQRLLATGSKEGVVNVYDFDKVHNSRTPLPEKSFLNLRTAISDVKFNHTSELLAMSADEVPSAIKLAHFPSGTVFANFPQFKSDLGKIQTVEFSPGSGYLALGNRVKAVPLFRLKHFKNY